MSTPPKHLSIPPIFKFLERTLHLPEPSKRKHSREVSQLLRKIELVIQQCTNLHVQPACQRVSLVLPREVLHEKCLNLPGTVVQK